MGMRIAFRADASPQIGSGHLVRCLTLADALSRAGHEATFFCRHLTPNLGEAIAGRHRLVILPKGQTLPNDGLRHSAWLGTSMAEDAAAVIEAAGEAAGEKRFDWMIVDHYGISLPWEQALRRIARRIMVIDDLADRDHDCDLILDQNFRRSHAGRYDGLVPNHAVKLMGPIYALLQQEYAQLHEHALPRKTIERVLVYFGGGDTTGRLTKDALEALLLLEADTPFRITVNLQSEAQEYAGQINNLANNSEGVTVYYTVPSLAAITAASDVAISAIGGATWERLCLGVPSFSISFGFNQEEVAQELHDAGLIVYLGAQECVTRQNILSALKELLAHETLTQWSAKCFEHCDGQGGRRIVERIQQTG